MRYISWIEGTRWQGCRSYIRDLAIDTGMNLISLESEKNLFRERVYFVVEGSDEQKDKFREQLSRDVSAFNRR